MFLHMNPETSTIGVNTDPLFVQLYFDENNFIKWKLVFKDYSNDSSITTFQQSTQQTNNISEQTIPENILTNIYNHIFIIGAKNNYQFKYNDIQLEIDDTLPDPYEIEYNTFDHLKYNKLVNNFDLNKTKSWRHYVKNIKSDKPIKLDLNSIELSQINALINIIDLSITLGAKESLIIFGDFTVNSTGLAWLKKNKDKYELINGKILIFNSKISIEKKIDSVTNYNDIKGFIIKANLYNEFLKKLNEKKITWESCLYQLVEENQFDSFQLGIQLFS